MTPNGVIFLFFLDMCYLVDAIIALEYTVRFFFLFKSGEQVDSLPRDKSDSPPPRESHLCERASRCNHTVAHKQ